VWSADGQKGKAGYAWYSPVPNSAHSAPRACRPPPHTSRTLRPAAIPLLLHSRPTTAFKSAPEPLWRHLTCRSVANQGRRTAAAVATSADGHEAATARDVACATSWVSALCTQRQIPLPLPDNVPIHATAKHSAGRCSDTTLTGWRRSTRRSLNLWEAVPAGSLQREEKSNP